MCRIRARANMVLSMPQTEVVSAAPNNPDVTGPKVLICIPSECIKLPRVFLASAAHNLGHTFASLIRFCVRR